MGRKKKKYPVYEKVEILDIAAEGKAIAKKDDMVIFVSNAIPGDVVDLQVTKKRKNFMEAKAIHHHHHSPRRVKPFCYHFGTCGGCKWQDLNYDDQLVYKQNQVKDQLQRIGKLDEVSLSGISTIIASEHTRFYRNKLEFTFSNKRWLTREEMEQDVQYDNRNGLGFHIPGLFDKILDIRECYLQPEPSNTIRLAIKEYALRNNLDFFDVKNRTGFLRNLIIRTSMTGEVMVIVSFFTDNAEKRAALLKYIQNSFGMVTSLMYVINNKPNDTIADLPVTCFSGKDHIMEKIGDLHFKIGPKSFFQTNSFQALNLYRMVSDFASLKGDEIVYDLYTGTGTIANFIAGKCSQVIGIEQIPEAVRDAEENSTRNNIRNTLFFAGDIKDSLSSGFYKKYGLPQVVILDPPRAGVHKKVIDALLTMHPERIVYVSCNPATQARDIQLLSEKYTPEKIQPVDMFPHTYHVENILLLRKTASLL